MNKKIRNGILGLLGVVMLSACGQERDHKPLPKIEVFSKALVDTEAEYLYVPSTDQVSRTTRISRPYWQGEPKIVKFKYEKDFLVAYAQEKDKRFEDNLTNSKPVFRIPITHIDYREAKDPFGEGTNIEEENRYIAWDKRKYFEPKPEAFEFSDVNTLPVEIEQIFGSDCSKKVGQSELSFEVSKERIDIVIKKDFNSTYFCMDIEDLSDLAWSEVTHYSIVPMDKLVSQNYQTIEYDRSWERTFGFFDTLDTKVDSSNNSTQDQEVYYMNRWNPDREIIEYYLDPRFEKPENKAIKSATLLGIQRLNDALATAGVKFRVVAKDGDPNMRPGDLMLSSIVLVEDPLANGLLGYGPSVANPRTGEIVQARTVMYPGVMKKFIRYAYDELQEQEQLLKGNTKLPRSKLSGKNAAIIKSIDDAMGPLIQANQGVVWSQFKGELSRFNDLSANANPEVILPSDPTTTGTFLKPRTKWTDLISYGAKSFFKDTAFSLRSVFAGFKAKDESEFDLDHLDTIEILSKHNMLPARVDAFVDIKDGDLKDKILAIGQDREWDKLDENSRQQIVDLVMPYVWIPTLIHEMGHNLGLRHNFAGSEDRPNFYSEEELKNLGAENDFGTPYASMMEYTKSEIKGLRVPGKYDIAALRYGYLQQVELTDGSIVPVAATPDEMQNRKTFEYCSDEGVSLNPNCNRFDEGVGYVEIAQSIIDTYYDRYKLRNFRSGRANFSMVDDILYASSVNQQFRSLRLMLERFTDIVLDFDVPMSQVQQIDWLNEMNEGSKIAANFLKEIVAEPDYSCVIFNNGQFNAIVKFSEIVGFSGAKKCADIPSETFNPGFTIEGELGRRYNHEKFRDNPNIYLDQIDVRGVWMDKLLALRYLVARNLNEYSFDDYTLSYLDHPEIGGEINKFLKDLIVGNVIANTEITLNDGTKTDFQYAHNFSQGYQIKKPLLPYFNRALRLPSDQVDFMDAVLIVTKDNLDKGLDSIPNQVMRESLGVYTEYPRDGRDPSDFTNYKLGRLNYIAGVENEVSGEIINKLNRIDLYEKIDRQVLINVYIAAAQNQPLPATATPEEQEAYKTGEGDLLLYLVGEYPTKEYYSRVLTSLAR